MPRVAVTDVTGTLWKNAQSDGTIWLDASDGTPFA
jgi:hypothetical protein